jgi:hypothetical protein
VSPSKDAAQFWRNVERIPFSGCWIWTAGETRDGGYGRFSLNGRRALAHRLAFELSAGRDAGELCVCHKCDVRECVNPAHLFLGTRADNLADMHKKGRGSGPQDQKGEKHHLAKLTEADVLSIRKRLVAGETQTALARAFGVSQSQISLIGLRKKWGHL